MIRWIFLLLLACQLAFSVPEIDEASAQNMALAASFMGAKNPCGEAGRQPTEGDIFSVAGMRIISAIPQAGNTTSDLSEPRLLWSWFAEYPPRAAFSTPSGNACPGSKIEIYSPANPKLEGAKLTYRYGSAEKTVQLGNGGPNPVPLDLNASYLRMEDFAGLYANLSLEISGELSVEYAYRQTDYMLVCDQDSGGSFCGCELQESAGTRKYRKAVSDSRLLQVETGPVQEIWLSPPLQKRLAGNQSGKVLLFARRMPSKISVSADGDAIGQGGPYGFVTETGKCGEKTVAARVFPQGSGLKLEVGNASVSPPQLVDRNASYLPIYAEFYWSEAAGKREVRILYEDWFSHSQNFTRDFSVREPAAFYSNHSGAAMDMREGNDSLSPAAYPGKPLSGAPPHLSPIAILIAVPLLLGARALIAWLHSMR